MTDEELFDGLRKFLESVPDCPVWGKKYTSTCKCGGTITAIRSTYNGHLHAECSKCGAKLHE